MKNFAEDEYFEMESQEIENVSTLKSGSKAMTNDLNSSTKLPVINDTLRSQLNGTVINQSGKVILPTDIDISHMSTKNSEE